MKTIEHQLGSSWRQYLEGLHHVITQIQAPASVESNYITHKSRTFSSHESEDTYVTLVDSSSLNYFRPIASHLGIIFVAHEQCDTSNIGATSDKYRKLHWHIPVEVCNAELGREVL